MNRTGTRAANSPEGSADPGIRLVGVLRMALINAADNPAARPMTYGFNGGEANARRMASRGGLTRLYA